MAASPAPDTVLRLVASTNNVFALPDGGGMTLIDAGPDYEGAWEELTGQLAGYGFTPADVHTVVLTHGHLDHAGLAARWRSAGARVAGGHHDAAMLARDDRAREQERAFIRAAFIRHGVPPAALDNPIPVGERYTRWPAPLRMTPVDVDAVLDGGDSIGERRPLRILACPGHTPGTLLIHEPAIRAVFTGDHVLPRMAPTTGVQFDGERRRPSLPAYLASLRAARALAAACTVAYPGHGEPITDIGDAVDWTIRLLEQRARRAHAFLQRGPATAYDLALRMFPHLSARHLRPVVADTIGVLDLLAERGLAIPEQAGERCVWRAGQTSPPTP